LLFVTVAPHGQRVELAGLCGFQEKATITGFHA